MSTRLLGAIIVGLWMTGCSRQPPAAPADLKIAVNPNPNARPGDVPAQLRAPAAPAYGEAESRVDTLLATYTAPSKGDRYDAAMNEALGYLADKKYARALAAFEDARAIDDTEQVRRELDRARDQIAQQAAAERAARDVRTVLADGKPEDAGPVLTAALKQFGGSDASEELAGLKRQADALTAEGLRGAAERRDRFAREAAAALADNNLRAAALALEQALQAGEDDGLRRQYTEVHGRLDRYDDARRRAAELRRDRTNLEAARDALRAAGAAWDTLQVRQEMDDCALALQRRRDRVGVMDFETRGDVRLAAAGRTIAEELMPALKARFDVVERGQLDRVLGELQLQGGDLSAGQQVLGQVARVRYLVLGSVSALNGVTINARLVEVNSGLVAQTARLSGASVEALLPRLPLLGQMLMMTDEQKLAFEQALAQQAPPVQPIAVEAVLPPLPDPTDPLPPPVVAYTARPPAFGGLLIADFGRFAVALAPNPTVEVTIGSDDPYRRRLLAVSLELGDNLFRRGRQREAMAHFELALNLSDGHRDVALRVERCRPFMPPPVVLAPAPVVVVVPQPVPVAPQFVLAGRPRLAVFNFLVNCEPGLVPPAVGDWAADQFVSYCGSSYDIIERGEVCWYMGRLNITMKDVLDNPAARRALSQALNVRFFLFGTIEQTASLNVATHMVDAQTGASAGSGTIHVQDHNELKLRMQELVRQTGAGKNEQIQMARTGAASEKALTEARKQLAAGDGARAVATTRAALASAPGNVALLALAQQAEEQKKQAELESSRRAAAEATRAQTEAARRKQQELVKEAEALRVKAQAQTKAGDEAGRRAAEDQKDKAAARLRATALAAAQKGDYQQAVGAMQSANALKPDDSGLRALADLKAKSEDAARRRAAVQTADSAAAAKRLAEAAAAEIADERGRRQAEESARRQAQEARDQAEQARLVALARQAVAKGQFDAARSAVEAARLLKATDEVAQLAKEVQDARARADANAKGEAAQREAERRLAEDKVRADKTALAAKQNQDLAAAKLRDDYNRLMTTGRQSLTLKKYDDAANAFTEALRLQPGDAAAAQALGQTTRERTLPTPKSDPRTEYNRLLESAAGLEKAKKTTEAIAAYRKAWRLIPNDAAVLAALRRVEVPLQLTAGKQALVARRFAEAAQAFEAVLEVAPDNAEAKAGVQKARKGETK